MTKPSSKLPKPELVAVSLDPTEEDLARVGKIIGRTPDEVRRVVAFCEALTREIEKRDMHPSDALTGLLSMLVLALQQAPKDLQPELCTQIFHQLWDACGLKRE